MKICPECGTDNATTAKECKRCGEAFSGKTGAKRAYVPITAICPKCGIEGRERWNGRGDLSPVRVVGRDGKDFIKGWYHDKCRPVVDWLHAKMLRMASENDGDPVRGPAFRAAAEMARGHVTPGRVSDLLEYVKQCISLAMPALPQPKTAEADLAEGIGAAMGACAQFEQPDERITTCAQCGRVRSEHG